MIVENKLKKIFTFFICIMPILHQYASPIPNITLGEIFFVCYIPLSLMSYSKIKIDIKSPYLVYIYIMIVVNLLTIFIQDTVSITSIIVLFGRLFFYFYVIVIMGKMYFDFKFGAKVYILIAKFTSYYLIAQTIVFYSTNMVLPSVVTFLPLYKNDTYHLINHAKVYERLFRPQSVFLEPGTFAQYVLPCLALALFGSKFICYKNNLREAVLFTIALFLSLSAQGYIITLVLWGIWLFFTNKNIRGEKKIFMYLSIIFSVIITVLLVFNVDFLYRGTIGRFTGDGGYDSTGVRVIRGFQVFSQLGIVYKFIGVGFGNVTTFVLRHGITTPNDLYMSTDFGNVYNLEYMNGFAYILVTSGIISLVAYLFFIGKMFKNTLDFARVSIVILILYSIATGVLISPTWVVIMSFIYREYEERTSNLLVECGQ